MKKNKGKIDFTDIICTMLIVFVISIAAVSVLGELQQIKYNKEINECFEQISECEYLVYDKETFVIYYRQTERIGCKGFGYLAPYYSKNGKLCQYIDNKIVEIDNL